MKNQEKEFLSSITSNEEIQSIIQYNEFQGFEQRRLLQDKLTNFKFVKALNSLLLDFFTKNIKLKWVTFSISSFFIICTALILFPPKINPNVNGKYTIYSSKPLVLGDSDVHLYAKDARSQRINEIFKQYNCPLEGLGEVFVMEADKNNIPWWVVAAISFQESSCGKLTPEVLGVESYNAWGWAVYGDNVQMFNNWVRGIETVSEYLSDRFYSQGITDLCEIMKTYTPPSKGSWCKGVQFFGDEILYYKSPQSLNY